MLTLLVNTDALTVGARKSRCAVQHSSTSVSELGIIHCGGNSASTHMQEPIEQDYKMVITTNTEAILHILQDYYNNILALFLGPSLDQAMKCNIHKYLCKLFLIYCQIKENFAQIQARDITIQKM